MRTQTAKRLHWLVTAPLLIGAVIMGYTTQSKASGLGIKIIGDSSINFHTVNMNGLRIGNNGHYGSNPSQVSLHSIQGHGVRTLWPGSRKHMNLQATQGGPSFAPSTKKDCTYKGAKTFSVNNSTTSISVHIYFKPDQKTLKSCKVFGSGITKG